MIVIVDGLDCSGKSTVYDRLYQNVKKAYFVRNSYPGPSDQERVDRLNLFKRRLEEPYLYIYDRATVIDDPVYEYMFNQRDSILEDMMDPSLFKNVLVLHFTVEKEEWLKRMKARGDQYVSIDNYEQIDQAYKVFYDKYKPIVEVIDTTHKDRDEAYNAAFKAIENFRKEK